MHNYMNSIVTIVEIARLRVNTDSMDDIENLVIAFMILLIARLMAEHATSRWPRKIRSVHNSNLQGNAWLTEMLNNNSPVRCPGLL